MADCFLWPLVVPCTVTKPWNVFWLKKILSQDYCLDRVLIWEYLLKNMGDALCLAPALIITMIRSFYDPLATYNDIVAHFTARK